MNPHAERNVLIDVQVRKKRVFLKNGIDLPLVRRQRGNFLTVKKDISFVRRNEAADDTQRRCLAAAGRTEQRHKLSVPDVEIQISEHRFPVKGNGDVLQ